MLKAKIHIRKSSEDGPVMDTLYVIGLTAKNIELLMDKKPISFNASEMGLPDLGKIVVMYGTTEAEIEADLRSLGAIGVKPF